MDTPDLPPYEDMILSGAHHGNFPPPVPAGGRIVGFIDIGTNSVRLLVVRINANGSYVILTRQKGTVRLGDGAFECGVLSAAAVDRCVTLCLHLVELARSFRVEEIVTVATAATREAGNCRDLLTRLRHEVGIDVRVISGREEARLIYLGVTGGVEIPEGETALFIDIGGGSTEVVIGNRSQYLYLESLKLGAIRLTNHFFPDGAQTPVDEQSIHHLKEYIKDTAVRVIQEAEKHEICHCFGSSGTIENLAEIAARMAGSETVSGMLTIPKKDLSRAMSALCQMSLNKRRSLPGMNPDRADIIIGGGLIITTLMEDLHVETLTVSNRGLQDGLLVDYLSRIENFPLLSGLSLRERSIVQIGRSFGINEYHARTVAETALELFESGFEAGLHDLGAWEREMLEYAAFLHDIGSSISYVNHQAHSAYIIKNVELLGFDRTEQAFMAHIARYHRKKSPGKKVPADPDLPHHMVHRALALSAFLRLAESLDRSHTALIRHARFVERDDESVLLYIEARGDCHLEVWGVENEKKAFSKVFHADLRFRVAIKP